MKPRYQRLLAAIVLFLGWSFSMQAGVAAAQAADVVTYKVTIMNLTKGQPFSPPVAATHRDGLHMFQVGQVATDQLAATAQDGNPVPLYKLVNSARFGNSAMVTQKVIKGNTVTDSASFVINASPGDTFSLATMLICTNDGFLGLDSVALPIQGSMTYDLKGYDAGREQNTELSKDIVDPCSALGPVKLAGDPNGNIDGPVATSPAQPIALHPGIKGGGDLSVALHSWTDPVASVTITRLGTDMEDPASPLTNPLGMGLWAAKHGGDPSGYSAVSRADQIKWNSVAIHGR